MIARERRSTGHRRYGHKSGLRIERLEDRTLLSSTAANVFAQFPGVLSSPGDTQQISIALHAADFTLGTSGKVTLGFQIEPAAGSSLDPAPVQIEDGDNHTVSPDYVNANLANNTQSLVLADLSYGEYTLAVSGQGGTSGAFQLDVFLAGDANGSRTVDGTDGALIQSLLGSVAGDSHYRVEADANLDGVIDATDYSYWLQNQGAATTINPLSLAVSLSPAPVTLPDAALATNVRHTNVVGTTNPGATVDLQVEGDDPTTTADASGNFSFRVKLDEGPNTLQVQATDDFGQQQTTALSVISDDDPPAVAVTSPADGLVTNTNPTITGQVTDDFTGVASLQAQVDNGSFVNVPFDASGNFSFATALPLSGAADGNHTVHLQATDGAGNVSDPIEVSFTLDTQPPTVVIVSPTPGALANDNITVTGQATDSLSGVQSVQAQVDGGGFFPVDFDDSGSFSFDTSLATDGSADGVHTVQVQATDQAGNVSAITSFTFTLDTLPPTVVIASPAPDAAVNNDVITGQVTDALSGVASLQAQVDCGSFFPVVFDATGHFSFSAGLPLDGSADGDHTVALEATDKAGNVSDNVDVSFTLDTQPPTVTIDSPAPGFLTNSNVTVAGEVDDALSGVASLQAQVDNGPFANVTFNDDGNFSFITALRLDGSADGTHVVNFRATDVAGNTSQPVPLSFTLNTHPPLVTITGPTGMVTTNTNVTITGLATDPLSGVASLQAAVDSSPFTDVAFDSSGNFSFTTGLALDGSADGIHNVLFRATNNAGNTFDASFSFTLLTQAPTTPVFALDPTANTGTAASPITTAGIVTFIGHTDPNITVTLDGPTFQTISSNTGAFQFANVPLTVGTNTFTAQASDVAGSSSFTLSITRQPPTGQENEVLVWNQAVLNAIQQDASDPLAASRAMAMAQAAIFDAVSAIEGTPGYAVHLTAAADASANAAVASAAHTVLSYLYPVQQATFDALLTSSLASIPDGQGKTDGISLGQTAGNDIIALRANDGWNKFVDFVPNSGPGQWQPTPPMFMDSLAPQWATMQPWIMTADNQFRPAGPPALNSQAWADAFNEVKAYGSATSTVRTADQTQIARFWADNAGSYTPPGHWNQIAAQVAQQAGDSLAEDARLFAVLDITLADAAIAAWDAKYTYTSWRPITAIPNAGQTNNPNLQADPNWTPLLVTPNFPEYVSGHSTFSAAAATVLDAFFGTSYSFRSTAVTLPGVTRSFTSFDQAAAEAGQSRIYAGIHFQFSNQDGQATGRALGNYAVSFFNLAQDTIPPKIALNSVLPSGATNHNFSLTGQVTDNLSGVASLTVQVDQNSVQSASFDGSGNFSILTSLPLDGSADGTHTLTLVAKDFAGNASAPVVFSFILDTKAPLISITSPANNSTLAAGAKLSGTVTTTGAPITAFFYAFDGGTGMPIPVVGTGAFTAPLDLSKLPVGSHTLTVTAQDAAGNSTSSNLTLTEPALVPLTITNITPASGTSQVGVTFRPEVVFSRPIDPTTLTSNDFYASDTTNTKLPATIVPSQDGTFAWLFFTNPLPGASTITLTVDGSGIKAPDGALLDASGTGTAGSRLTTTFTTVNQAALPGTSLTGIVADPGPDLKPGTFDDVRPGPDGVLNTADDVYLNPIAGVKVYILGLQSQAVFTDSQGRFTLTSIPPGDVKLVLDGTTATSAPAGIYYPEMVMDLTIKVGQVNTVMGSMGPNDQQLALAGVQGVYLPRLQTGILHNAGGNTATTIGLDPAAATDLTSQQAGEYSITVAPNSLVGMGGQTMSSGQVGFSTVSPSLVRDMLPQGVMQLATTLTIQAPGVATFSTPLQVTFANVYGAAPGSTLDVYSFNHTTGMLEITGTATVSPDGKTVTTDPGSGITHPGWFGVTPPGDCGGSGGAPPQTPPANNSQTLDPIVLPMLTGENGQFPTLTFTETEAPKPLPPPGPPGCPPPLPPNKAIPYLEVKIDVDGPLSDFMNQTGTKPLSSTSFILYLNETETFGASAKPYADMFTSFFGLFGGGLTSINTNILFGSKITVTQTQYHFDGSSDQTIQPYYLYRFIDATDSTPNDGTISFEKTIGDGQVSRQKPLEIRAGGQSTPTIQGGGSGQFSLSGGGTQYTLTFMPTQTGDQNDSLTIQTPDGHAVPSPIKVEGFGIPQEHLYVDQTSIINTLSSIAQGTDPNTGPLTATVMNLIATPAERAAIAAAIAAKTYAKYGQFSEGITPAGSAADPNTITITFTSTAVLGLLGDSSAAGGIDNATDITTAVNTKDQYNQQTQDYILAQAINEKSLNAPYGGTVFVYLNTPLENGNLTTADQLTNTVAKSAAHEVGHTLGLVHTFVAGSSRQVNAGGFLGFFSTQGKTDLMAQGFDVNGSLVFQPGLTVEAIDMALGINWTQDNAQTAYSYYTKAKGLGFFDNVPAGDEDPPPPAANLGTSFTIAGPHLDIFNTQTGDLITSHFDFGSVPVDASHTSPATASITLANDGSQNLVLSSVGLSSSITPFVVSGVAPGTVLQPGDNIQLQISFDPGVAGSASADLHIVSNEPNAPSDIGFTGFGQSQNSSIALSLANNDLGGVAVGSSSQSANLATISNQGAQPLVLFSIQVEAGGSSFVLIGVPANLATNPITLATGQSFTFGVQYTASKVGLERAKIDVASNDPNQPVLIFGVMGTGLDKIVYPHWGNDYVAIEFPKQSSSVALRAVSDASGNFSFFLPPNQAYHLAIFDPITGLIANRYGVTPPSGQGLNLTSGLVFGPSTTKDTDYDGLPDDVEFAIGTSPTNAFTAGDGIDDFTHVIIDQTSPLKGPPLVTGVIATLPLSGDAEDVTVVGSTTDPNGQTAYVATGSYGLAVLNASNFLQPLLLGQIQLPGNSTGIAVDPQLQIAAVASHSGLNLVDVKDPTQPKLLQTVNIPASAVKIFEGVAYAANGTQVTAIDLLTGQQIDQETFSGGTVDDLGIDQGNLYVLVSAGFSSHTVYKVTLTGTSLPPPSYSLIITGHPTFGRMHLFAGGGYVYVGASDNNNSQEIPGVEVIQDTGTALNYVGPSSGITAFNVAVNSNGLALYTGANPGLEATAQVGMLDLSDPTQTGKVMTVFNTPGVARSIAIAEGIGFIADQFAGLAILNYLPFDSKGIPPTVSISTSATDVDLLTPGLQVFEGSTVPVSVNATDDVQVRNVELLVNGQVVENAVSFPFNLSAIAPSIAQSGKTFTIQVRAIDTGGNVGVSNILTIGLVSDTSPPTISKFRPANGSSQVEGPQTVQVTFTKPLAAGTVTATNFQLQDSSNHTITPTNLELRDAGRLVEITYPPLVAGTYQLVINGPAVTDRVGNALSTGNVTDSFTLTPRETLTVANPDADPTTPGLQLFEAVTVTGSVTVNSGVAVQSIKILLNGQVLSSSATAPLSFSFIAPLLSAGASSFTLVAQVTDTSGFTTTTAPLVVGLLKDTTPPTIVSTDPANGATSFAGLQSVKVLFSKPIARTSVTAANFQIIGAGPDGIFGTSDDIPIAISAVTFLSDDTVVQLTIPPLAAGLYRLQVQEAGITDRVGNPLGTGTLTSQFTVQKVQGAIVVADNATHSVTVIDAATDTVRGSVSIGFGADIGDVAVTADGTLAFVTDFNSQVWVIDLTTAVPQLASGTNPIPIANQGEDLSITPDQKFVVASDGGNFQPLSVIDIASRTQVSTFSTGSDANSVEVLSDNSVLVTSISTGTVRRLKIDSNGTLTDTGEVASTGDPNNVFAAPGGTSAIVITRGGNQIHSFLVPGLVPVDTRTLSGNFGISGVVNPAGDRVYARGNGGFVDVFTYNSATGALGAAPLFSIPIASTPTFYGMDQMAISPNGALLYVSQPGSLNVYDAGTGALVASITDPHISQPTGVAVSGGQPQFFAGNRQAPAGDQANLTQAQLRPVVTQAITNLAAAGYQVSTLSQVDFHLTHLPGSLLGLTYLHTIWIDQNAAGYGWYLDVSANSTAAFSQVTGANELQAAPGSPAYGHVDLLTVVTHELGHVLGFASIDPGILGHDWMTATLETGVRRYPDVAGGRKLPAAGDVPGAMPTAFREHGIEGRSAPFAFGTSQAILGWAPILASGEVWYSLYAEDNGLGQTFSTTTAARLTASDSRRTLAGQLSGDGLEPAVLSLANWFTRLEGANGPRQNRSYYQRPETEYLDRLMSSPDSLEELFNPATRLVTDFGA